MKEVKSFVITLICGMALAASASAMAQNPQADKDKKDSYCATKDCCKDKDMACCKDKDCCKDGSCSKDGSCCCGDSCQMKHEKKDGKNKQ
ncbi:MAG: hypothetical protein ABR607_03375 [Pyrinomonadaceae bacterium]